MHEPTCDVSRRTDVSPLLLFLPPMGVPASFHAPFAEHLRRVRLDAVVPDLPGQGQRPLRARRGDDHGCREVVEGQLPQALHQLARRHPGRPLRLGGHSLGGQLAVPASHSLQKRVQGVVLVPAGSAHWRTWPQGRRARAALTVHAIAAAARRLAWYPGRRLGRTAAPPCAAGASATRLTAARAAA